MGFPNATPDSKEPLFTGSADRSNVSCLLADRISLTFLNRAQRGRHQVDDGVDDVARKLAPWGLGRFIGLRPTEFAVRVTRASMRTSDATLLVANVYYPWRAGRTPTILVRLPYSKNFTNALFSDVVGRMWAEHGYTAVIQGTRGRYESGGEYYPLRDERRDG